MKVRISSSLLEQIVHLAARQAVEVCGLLLGEGRRITAILPAANVVLDPARHFELDPAILIAAHRAARQGGPAVLGHYHSHPSGRAEPSRTDVECARPDGTLWLIVGGEGARLWVAQAGEDGNLRFIEADLATE